MSLKRDEQTFLAILAANKGIIYKVANSYCKDEENRKDLIQEIAVQLWLAFDKYNEAFKISTWMYRIALNVSISFYRKETRRSEINQQLPEEIIYLADHQAGAGNEAIQQLNLFIKSLKELDKAIILLYLEEHSQQEIAEILGLSVTNVSTKIGRIKLQLRQKFSNLKDQ